MENLNSKTLEDILNIINVNQFKIKALKRIIFNNNCIPFHEIKEKMDLFLCELEFDFNNIFEMIKYYQIIYEDLSQKINDYIVKESSLTLKIQELYDELQIINNNNEKLKTENQILKSNTLNNFYSKSKNEILKKECDIYENTTSK